MKSQAAPPPSSDSFDDLLHQAGSLEGLPTVDLIRAARGGDDKAWAKLDERYRVALRLVARGRVPRQVRGRFDTDDLLQTTFFAAFQELDGYAWRGDGSFLAWLRRILENRLSNTRRSAHRQEDRVGKRAGERVTQILDGEGGREGTPSELNMTDERQARLVAALVELDDFERRIVQRHLLDSVPLADLTDELGGFSESTLRRNLARAMGRISHLLKQEPEA